VSENQFAMPEDSMNLDPKTKRALTICNLFVNHGLPMADIARLLDEDHGTIILALIKDGIIYDRRQRLGNAPLGIERRLLLGGKAESPSRE
jgi:hypothetical protein